MSLSPVTFRSAAVPFRAQENKAPGNATNPGTQQAQNMQNLEVKPGTYIHEAYKPGLIAKVRAFFTNLAETTKGAVVGMFYGIAAGGPAAVAAALLTKGSTAVKSTKLGKVILAAAAIGGTLVGALAGKSKTSDSIKGAGVGFLYGAAGGAASALTVGAMNMAKKGKLAATPAWKAALISAVAVNTVIGAWVGKLIANGKIGKIYDQHGRSKWSTGK